MPKTKIICTIGPSSSNETVLRKMMLAGMDVARLNFSHGSHETHLKAINLIRLLNKKYRRSIKILQDLEGYRIRIGRFKGSKGIELKKKQVILLTNKYASGSGNIVTFDYEGDLRDIKKGSFIYIDDGNIALIVRSHQGKCLKAEVVSGGFLKEHKGINIPDIALKFSGLKKKDKTDILFGIKNRVDYIAQSFVRSMSDIDCIRKFIGNSSPLVKLIAKIENRAGIRNISGIMSAADGIMVARGDMGVSLPIYKVPMLQKFIISQCRKRRKFVITATQMLESMAENVRPHRAEVSDVANAVIDGSDFVMLSAETAAGKYPVESVDMMNKVIKYTEESLSSGIERLKY